MCPLFTLLSFSSHTLFLSLSLSLDKKRILPSPQEYSPPTTGFSTLAVFLVFLCCGVWEGGYCQPQTHMKAEHTTWFAGCAENVKEWGGVEEKPAQPHTKEIVGYFFTISWGIGNNTSTHKALPFSLPSLMLLLFLAPSTYPRIPHTPPHTPCWGCAGTARALSLSRSLSHTSFSRSCSSLNFNQEPLPPSLSFFPHLPCRDSVPRNPPRGGTADLLGQHRRKRREGGGRGVWLDRPFDLAKSSRV